LHAVRQADLAAAEANVRRLEQLKSFQKVVAPFSGTITARNVEVGSLIQAGSASPTGWLFKLSQIDTIRVHASVPQSSMRLLKAGMSVDVLVPELGDKTFAAKVARSAGAFDAATRTMLVEMHVPNQGGPLLPGMYGQVRLHLVNEKPNLQVPINALMIGGSGARVAVVDKDDVIHIRPVRIGRDFGKEVEILDGLDEKERVVSNPRDNLVDGVKVRAVEFQAHSDKKDAPKSMVPADTKPAAPVPAPDGKPKS
jgi:RND family efflux transporter MFP subunit